MTRVQATYCVPYPLSSKPDQLDPWIKYELGKTLMFAIVIPFSPEIFYMWKDKPSELTQKVVIVRDR